MGKHIALLRGINVGGNNKISMSALKATFERYGFSGVETYINSGNILFESENNSRDAIKKECEAIISSEFGLAIAVTVMSAEELISAAANVPDWWNADVDTKHNAIFVIPPATAEEIIKEVGAIKPEYEIIGCYGSVIFWSAPIKTFSRTRWSKVAGTRAYNSITIRNANTFMKLVQLAERNPAQ